MKESLLHLFEQYPGTAIIISLLISIVIAIAGLIPSFFITAANIIFFGFWPGIVLSFAGEVLGATISFALYRKGFKKTVGEKLYKYPRVKALVNADDKKAVPLILSLRLLPFVPSGLVTFAAAVGKVSFFVFAVASSLGKIPALLIEGYSVYQVSRFGWQGKLILAIVGVGLLFFALRQFRNSPHDNSRIF